MFRWGCMAIRSDMRRSPEYAEVGLSTSNAATISELCADDNRFVMRRRVSKIA